MRKLFGLVALLLVLALGVAIGAGPLGDRIDDKLGTGSDSPSSSAGPDGADGADADSASDPLDQAFIEQVAPTELAGALTGQSVSIIALPGSSTPARSALTRAVAAAGGTVTSTVEVSSELTDPASKQLVDSLGSQLTTQVPGVVGADLTTYPRMGALLGAAVASNGTAVVPAPSVETLRDALSTGDLVEAPITGATASLVLVVAGTDVDAPILDGLLTGLKSQAKGLVLTGETNDGDVAEARDADLGVGTYDGVETAAGQVSTVNLLARQLTTAGGSYGASGSDGTVVLR